MVRFYSSDYSYDYSFSAVSLAYFLRYPNPYSRHVASTDTISRSFDPATQRLTTVRLHVKRSRVPPAVLKLLGGGGAVGANPDGSTRSFILERSVVDVREGWMATESRNLDWNNVLSVIERHTFSRPPATQEGDQDPALEAATLQPKTVTKRGFFSRLTGSSAAPALPTISSTTLPGAPDERPRTDVAVSVILKSRVGEQIRKQRARWTASKAPASPSATATTSSPAASSSPDDADDTSPTATTTSTPPTKQGWFDSWTTGAMRAAIENIGLQRTEKSQPKAQLGMSVVLARLRTGGWEAVLEGMRADGEGEPVASAE